MFWTIECWQEESERVLTERLKMFAEHRDRLNSSSQQIPSWAYRRAKKGIAEGEALIQPTKSVMVRPNDELTQ